MSDNTNMFTVRKLGGQQLIELNGREIPFVRNYTFAKVAEGLINVQLDFDVGQVNEVDHGEDIVPRSTGNPRADKYLRVIIKATQMIRDARWWQLPRVIKNIRAMFEGVMS